MRLDPSRSMIDVGGLILIYCNYLLEVVDGGITPKFRENSVSHRFPWFIDPIGMVVPV